MKNILITGSTDGIGRETAIKLAEKGHRIIVHGRNENKSWKVKGESGGYFVNKKKKKAAAAAYKIELQDQLWNKSIEMIKYQEIINKITV